MENMDLKEMKSKLDSISFLFPVKEHLGNITDIVFDACNRCRNNAGAEEMVTLGYQINHCGQGLYPSGVQSPAGHDDNIMQKIMEETYANDSQSV